jgi:uncharacterized membrane protein YheB (UPF0754 family)
LERKSKTKLFSLKINILELLFISVSLQPLMHLTGYIFTIILSTFTGWITTWVAIKMLFHPRKPIKIFGITIQGIFPKNQRAIAEKLGQVVGKELLSFAEIEQKVTNPENLQKLRPDIEAHVDNFLRNKLKDVFPMLSMFIGDKTITQLKDAFLVELEALFPVLMKNYMNKLQHDLDLEKIVTEKVAGFSSGKLEDILNQITKKEFQFLEIIGGIFGFVIGLVQVLVALLLK